MPEEELTRSQLWNFSTQPKKVKGQIINEIAKNGWEFIFTIFANGKNQAALENVIIKRIKELIKEETSVIILLYYVNRLYGLSCYYYDKLAADYKSRLNQLVEAENDWKELLVWLLALLPQDRYERYHRRFETVRHKLVAEIIIERLRELLREADEEARITAAAILEPMLI